MPRQKHTALTLATIARANFGQARKDRTPEIASVKHHEYGVRGKSIRSSFQSGTDDRPTHRESPMWSATPERRRGRLARDWQQQADRKAGRKGWDEVVGKSSDGPKPLVVRSSEVRVRDGNGFTGDKLKGSAAEASDNRANTMRKAVAIRNEFDHGCMVSGNALRDGRPQYRNGQAGGIRSSEKLGDGKAGI